jgi:acyl-CoA synthetase (AMP-forming)/AMP-acid ligase II
MNLVEKLREHDPAGIAIIDRQHQITFGELHARVRGGADLLQNKGLRKGDHVLVLHPITIELYEVLLSCFYAGLVVILVDPARGPGFLKKCLEWIPPDAFVGSPKAQLLRLKHRSLRNAFVTGARLPFTHFWRPGKSSAAPAGIPADHPALITFTSGSTGTPKGIVRSHRFLLAQDEALAPGLDLRAGQTDLVTLPVFLLSNLAHGLTSVIADTDLTRPGFPDVPKILAQVRQHKITRCTASPAFFEKMPDEFFTALDQLHTGGAPVFPDLLSRFPAKTHAVYGSSEAEPVAHFPASDLTPEVKEIIEKGGGLPVGRPIDEISLRIIDEEILVTGDHVLKGYLDGRGDAECKVAIEGQIWHRTGDAGRLDGKGHLWLLGRHVQKWENHFPLQIEAAVHLLHPGARCAFYRGTLFLEKNLKIDLEWAPIRQIKVIEKIPMDLRHNAKVDYPALENYGAWTSGECRT